MNNNIIHIDAGVMQPTPPDATSASANSSNKESVVQFWAIFRNVCLVFQNRINALFNSSRFDTVMSETSLKEWDDVVKNELRAHYATASKRNEGRVELDDILKEVRLLQRRVLSSTSSLVTVETSTCKNETLNSLLSEAIPDLAQADIRLLSAEIERILAQIDDAREIICPKEKFVFRRYRQALANIDQNCSGLAPDPDSFKIDDEQAIHEGKGFQEKEQNYELNFGAVIENEANCVLTVQSDRSVVSTDDADSQDVWKQHATTLLFEQNTTVDAATGASSYLLQNLTNSTIIIHPTLQSLHIQNINNCKIYSSVLGPVHVTNCHNSEIRCSAYQLRVHDSKNVKFQAWVRSGPIIEDCTSIVFAGNFYESGSQVGRNMYWDVKDFNWLRSLRSSPNFSVVETIESDASTMNETLEVIKSNRSDINASYITTCDTPNTADDDDDSEDEL